MAELIIFPDQEAFERSRTALDGLTDAVDPLYPPEFCRGLAAPSMIVTGSILSVLERLETEAIPTSGVIPYRPFRREVPEADAPEPHWARVVGAIRIASLRPSLTDPHRLTASVITDNDLGFLTPYMACLIRGGTFKPEIPILAFEEGHKLVVISPEEIVISRADDLLDLWIVVRTTIDLILAAWESQSFLKPEVSPRYGVGATEIFKRLPGTNCGACGNYNCMEFAVSLLARRRELDQCAPMFDHENIRYLESLKWLMRAIVPGK